MFYYPTFTKNYFILTYQINLTIQLPYTILINYDFIVSV